MKSKKLTLICSICLILVLVSSILLAACAQEAEAPATPAKPAPAPEAEVIELQAQSVWAPGTWEWDSDQGWVSDLEIMSGGRLKINTEAPGAIVAAFEQLDAVNDGVLDVSFSWGGYWMGKNSAFALIASLPAGSTGLSTWQYVGWIFEGGGLELYQELFDNMDYDIKAFIVQADFPEPLGWFNKEIKTLEDFKGMKYRAGGMGALVYEEMGMTVVTIPGGEIIQALEKGLIDGGEWSDPHADAVKGFQDVVKYYHVPGLHQTAAGTEALFNGDVWRSLPKDLQKQVEVVSMARPMLLWSKGMTSFRGELKALEDQGVIVVRTPDSIIVETMKAWDIVAAKESASNPDFKKVYESQKSYAEQMIYSYRLLYPNDTLLWDHYWPE